MTRTVRDPTVKERPTMTQPTSGVEHGDGVEPSEHLEQGEHEEQGEQGEHEEHEEHDSEGHSVAAWTAVGIILLGSLVMALAVVFPSLTWFIVGAVVVLVGIITGKVLAMAGYGEKASTYQAAHRAGGRAELPGRQQHDSGTQ